ncbi:MAG: type II secretion system ATPase GspE [Kiritimatiellae bacterium]|nr:type II secretion system ATPase GspE [Kiritimatiellia bacterium]MDD5522173.1 type II secretion system ATPase GspE [Kiritimatiellia bacterium]
MTSNDQYVLQILREHAVVSEEQIQKAMEAPGNPDASVVDKLLESGVLTESEVLATLAGQFGMELMSLKGVDITPEIRDMVPVDIARRYKVVPVFKTGDTLTVALSDPLDFDTLDTLRYVLKCNIEGVIAPREEIRVILDRFYAAESSVESMIDQIGDSTVDVAMTAKEDLIQEADTTESDAPIIKLVSLVILEAFRNRASDIHLEPMEKRFRVRYRIDGVLHEVDSPPKRLQPAILSRVKIMAGMKISEKRIPQDGRIQVNIMGRELDLRVSSIPANHGESIVMRILDKQNLALGLPKLGFFSDDQQTFEHLIGLSDGILLVTGPTGSGKTTTLYACLSHINRSDRKIITVEDPVEYQLSGINQVQVREDIGMTFAAALRSILRQAPNIVMIGEIRDRETANIATEASLTGHLVFSTLHTNDAPSAVTRLLDIGVKPFLVASSVRAVMAQRLVRNICENCKEPYEPTDADLRLLGAAGKQSSEVHLSRGRGCNKCALTGYHGRKGIFEIFLITDEIQRMIFQKVTSFELRARAREMGMRTLREDGQRKAAAGITTLDEVMRVTMGDQD